MKLNTPLFTLLTGAALGIVLLIASMLAAHTKTPSRYTAASSPAPAAISPAAPASAASAAATASSPAAAAPSASATDVVKGEYAGRVHGGGASVAIAIHGTRAIAYVCNGSVVEAWFQGTAVGGRLVMTGKNGAQLNATYYAKKANGTVVADGFHYRFSVPAVRKPSGLYRATADVRGATIKAGWIVLPDGTQVGSLESDANAAAPAATAAPALDVAAGTAQDGSTVLHAIAISGLTGSGF
jgi:serine/threonine-protein kinase